MTVETFTVGELSTNCYLVWEADRAFIVDPGDEADRLLAAVKERGLTLETVFLTHLHFDHFLAVPALVAATGARLVIPAGEAPLIGSEKLTFLDMVPPARRPDLRPDRLMREGEQERVGSLTVTLWETPGHSVGGACYRCGDALFSGDTLFAGTIGKYDPPWGNEADMAKSLARLAACPEDLKVYPGHGHATTLAREQGANPFLK